MARKTFFSLFQIILKIKIPVCYIVGLGDRHASNILFDQKLCTFVHIDLGMILEYSKRTLPVPEQVPFRITRDVLDPILIEGIENGQLAEECTQIMEKLKENGKVRRSGEIYTKRKFWTDKILDL